MNDQLHHLQSRLLCAEETLLHVAKVLDSHLSMRAETAARECRLEAEGIRKDLGEHVPPDAPGEECRSCRGYGHFDSSSEPTSDRRGRKCLDCTGTGNVTTKGN